MVFKSLVKKIVLSLISKSGFLAFKHWKNRHKICVLMIHGVMASNDRTTWEPLRPQLCPDELKRTLTLLSELYTFISADQAFNILLGKSPPIKNAMLITLDDGYMNNLDYALPVFEEFGVKPLLFIVTGNIDSGQPFMVDRLDYALQQNMGNKLSVKHEEETYYFDASSRESLQESYKIFRDNCKDKFCNDIKMSELFNSIAEKLEEKSGGALQNIYEHDDWSLVAPWHELRKAVEENRLDVASHTVDHFRLDCLEQQELLYQLQESKKRIEKELLIKSNYFCYPNGNYNNTAIKEVIDSDYQAAFSTNLGLCEIGDDIMTLKRFNFPTNKTKAELLYLLNRKALN